MLPYYRRMRAAHGFDDANQSGQLNQVRLLMPYKYSKCGTAPVQVYIDVPLDTPEFTHLSDAEQFDDPDLSPIEFLQAVYRDPLLPMSIRIDAARGLLPYTEPRPTNSVPPRCKIIIGGLGPYDHGSAPKDP